MSGFDAAAGVGAALAVGGLGMTLANLGHFPRLAPASIDGLRVVACVAMRDEADNAAACIHSLLRQSEIDAVIVCDDGSCDETGDIVRGLARDDARIRVLTAGGGSKNSALAAAAEAARAVPHAFLLFTDADVRFADGAIGALLRYAQEKHARCVSAWPKVAVRGLGDVLITPAITLLLLHALPMWRTGSGDPRFAAANGQIMLVERHAYAAAGGHAAVRSSVEDIALARALARAGAPPILASAASIALVCGYGSVAAAIRGVGRSLFGACGVAGCVIFAVWQVAAFVVPLVTLRWSPYLSAAAVCAALVSRALAGRRMEGSTAAVAALPAAAAVCAAGAVVTALDGACGRIVWRGRGVRA